MAATEDQPAGLPGYRKLPLELKTMIWEETFRQYSPGAHHVQLKQSDTSPSKLMVMPKQCGDAKDQSAWLHIPSVLPACDIASFFDPAKLQPGIKIFAREENTATVGRGAEAVVDGENDLVVLQFRYGETLSSAMILENRRFQRALGGITRMGVDILQLKCEGLKYCPFPCLGSSATPSHTNTKGVCITAVVRFLRHCKDIRSFYIIVHLLSKDVLDLKIPQSESNLIRRDKTKSPGFTQRSYTMFAALQGLAKTQHLEQFHDRRGTYCEVTKDTVTRVGEIRDFDKIWLVKRALRRRWALGQARLSPAARRAFRPRSPRFKVLVYCDLRAAEGPNGEHHH